ncbi:MAG: hypothetical protein GY845_16500 [Planctomycetes bacterium]|nr:hypothetical protein [Planctomycetota bacterium]
MAKSKPPKNCFIIMPITTPEQLVERYKGDDKHFDHVLEHLFVPALTEAGFNPISPKSTGSNVIQAEIIKQLSDCELVLCDMSILNPNVFYEFGIRTALDKPVALVVDNKTKPIPFDTNILNYHEYDSEVVPWTLEDQMKELTKHVKAAYNKSKDQNALWKYFGVAQTGTFKPEEAEMGEKIDLIMNKLSALEKEQKKSEAPPDTGDIWSQNLRDPISLIPQYGSVVNRSSKHKKESVEHKIDDLQRLIERLEEKIKEQKSQEPDSVGGS